MIKLRTLVIALSCLALAALPASATETLKVLGQIAPSATLSGTAGSVTCTNASPMVCTWTASNLALGDQFQFTSGTPPTGTALNTTYFVISAGLTANAFELSTTSGGSAINSTGTGSSLIGIAQRVVYTVPGATSTVVSTITMANYSTTTADTVRVAIQPACAAYATKMLVAPGVAVPFGDTIIMTFGITMATTDCITVYTANGTTSFNVFGSEVQ